MSWKALAGIRSHGRIYEIGFFNDYPGIRWRLIYADGTYLISSGGFYDHCDDHPEGAIAWCAEAIRKDAAKRAAWCGELDA